MSTLLEPVGQLASTSGREPGYLQIAGALSARIRSGEFPIGHRLPSERALADQLGVSRVTTRQAIQVLHDRGLVIRRQGAGTYVSRPVPAMTASLLRFREQMQIYGITPSVRGLDIALTLAPSHVAETLGVPLAAQVIRVRQVLVGNGTPLGLTEFYFSAAAFAGLESLDAGSDFPELVATRYGTRSSSARMRLSPKVATAEEAAVLAAEPGSPLMVMSWSETDHRGWTFTCGVNVYRDLAASFVIVSNEEPPRGAGGGSL